MQIHTIWSLSVWLNAFLQAYVGSGRYRHFDFPRVQSCIWPMPMLSPSVSAGCLKAYILHPVRGSGMGPVTVKHQQEKDALTQYFDARR